MSHQAKIQGVRRRASTLTSESINPGVHTQHVKRLFILGAGFSRSISPRFPINIDLLEQLFEEDPTLAREWTALSSWFLPFLRAHAAEGVPEITSVLTALEAFRTFSRRDARSVKRVQEVQARVLYAAARCLWKASEAVRHNEVLSEFVSRLNPETDAVVTLNWDLVLENGLRQRGIPFRYDVQPDRPPNAEPSLLILKPQGSVNWVRCCPKERVFEPVLSISASEERDWNLSLRPDLPPDFREATSDEVDPAIITPAFVGVDRSTEFNWSGYLLRITTAAAQNAEKVVVVGYSLPRDDFHILTALSFGIAQDPSDRGVDIYIIEPSREIFVRWQDSFRGVSPSNGKPVSVRHWATTLAEGLERNSQPGPWKDLPRPSPSSDAPTPRGNSR